MESSIIQIGNSKGVILPSEMLRSLRLSLKSQVEILLEGGNIVIKASPRQGWAAAARQAHEEGGDELLVPDAMEGETAVEEDWTW